MNSGRPAQAVTALLLAALSAGAFAQRSSSGDYRDLVRNNMFLKNRPSVVHDPNPGEAAVTPATELQGTVLTGIVQQDGQYIAFLEDMRTNATTKARVGDTVCEGRISRITIDSIDYEPKGASKPTRVEVGKNLEGTDKSSLAPVVAPSASGDMAAPVGAAGVAPAAPGSAPLPPEVILERMRQRRMREMGK